MVGTSNIIAILLVLNLIDASTLVRGSAFEYSKDQTPTCDGKIKKSCRSKGGSCVLKPFNANCKEGKLDKKACMGKYCQCCIPGADIDEPECPDPPGESCIPVNSTHQSKCPQKYECFLDLAQKYEDTGSGFQRVSTVPCPLDVQYVGSCGKCDQCPESSFPDMCSKFNIDTCICELTGCSRRVFESLLICNIGVTFVRECNLCATCPVNECQVFNPKTCKCHTKFSCRARADKLKACAHPLAEYVEKCGTCAVCSDECQWFNTRTCKCQTATSWEGCAK